jgi:hypothetical protein
MLAYVFWHRPRDVTDRSAYDAGLRAFHRALSVHSACFWLSDLPFAQGPGYEDWYLVQGWQQLGELNQAAISGQRKAPHDAVAQLARKGWGAVYALSRGDPRPPLTARWMDKPPDESYEAFVDRLPGRTVWQRQLVLGPAPEFCVADEGRQPPSAPNRITVHLEGQ